jgi:hypothetical protein
VLVAVSQLTCSGDENRNVEQVPVSPPTCAGVLDVPQEPNVTAELTRTWGWQGSGVEFSEINSVVITPNLGIVVADGVSRSLKVLRPGARSWESFGRRGEGPGEFQYPTTVANWRGDTIAVFDQSLWRMSFYLNDSVPVRTQNVPAMSRFGQATMLAVARDGGLFSLSYDRYQSTVEASLGGKRAGLGRGVTDVVELIELERRWSQLFEVPGPEVFVDVDEGALNDVWFGADAHLAVTDANVWSADGRSGTLYVQDRRANRRCVTTPRNLERVAVTTEERDSFLFRRGCRVPRRGTGKSSSR